MQYLTIYKFVPSLSPVEGLCGFLPSGSIKIQLHVGSCADFPDFQSDSPGIASSSSSSSAAASAIDAIVPLSAFGGYKEASSDLAPSRGGGGGGDDVHSGSGLLKSVVMKNNGEHHHRKTSSSSSSSPSSSSSSSKEKAARKSASEAEKDIRLRSPISEPVIGYSAFEEKKLAKSTFDSSAGIWGDTHWAVGGGGVGGGVSVGNYDYDFEDHADNKNDNKNTYDYLTAVPPLTKIIYFGGKGGGRGREGYIQRGKIDADMTQEWQVATRIVIEEICASEIQL